MGNHLSRAKSAITAGCDLILACNDTPAAMQILDGLKLTDGRDNEPLIQSLLAQKSKLQLPLQKNQIWLENRRLLLEFSDQS